MPQFKNFYPSIVVNQLMGIGISLLTIELANRSLTLAGRKITHNSWVLRTVQSAFLSAASRALPSKSLDSTQKEIQNMLKKHAIEGTTHRKLGFLSTIFLVSKTKMGVQKPVINLKGLNIFIYTEHFKMEDIYR